MIGDRKRLERSVVIALAFVLAVCSLAAWAQAGDGPQLIGRASCATATCHGGIIGLGPAWHSSASVFESSDPHSRAGDVLRNQLSEAIVHALEPAARNSEEVFFKTLQDRCVSCHAPEGLSLIPAVSAAEDTKRIRKSLATGVSCEACHGPASVWEREHMRAGWDQSDRFSSVTGMLDTESLVARTDNCTRCHVGSRSADGPLRDMNHDMIAAGHPALHFDMLRYQTRLPPHWASSTDSLVQIPPRQLPQTAEALRTRVLLAAVRLSNERRADPAHAPQPELSEYDCGACHHALEPGSARQRRGSSGAALWHPWYTAGRGFEVPRDELRIDQPELEQLLRSLEESVQQRSESLMQAPANDPRARLKLLLSDSLPDGRVDYCGASEWLDQVEIAGRAVALDEASPLPEQFDELLSMFRKNVLGYQSRTPSTLDILLPRHWESRDIDALRKELNLCIAPGESRGRQ